MTRTTYRLTMAAIAAALCGTLLAATLPTSDPVHSGISQGQALGYIADNTQMSATGAGVATLPAANPQHTGLSQSQLLGYIADYTQDIAANGSGPAKAVRGATTANITISTALNAGDTLDGLTLVAGDRVLVKNQTATAENGIYVVGTSPARAADADAWSELPGLLVIIEAGTANKSKLYAFSGAETGTIGSTAITFAEKAAGGGGGGGTWGSITGDLADQTDLQTILDGSTGGNGAADSGKLVKFDMDGGFAGAIITGGTLTATTMSYSPQVVVTGGISFGTFKQEPGNELTSDRTYYVPDASGTMALQSWVTANTVAPSIFDAAGDLLYASAADTAARLAIGTEGQVLAASAGGVPEWITAPLLGTAQTFTAQNTFSKLPSVPRTDLSAGTALAIGTAYYDALSANRTITFSGTPAEGQSVSLKLAVTNVPVLTIPSSKRAGEADSAITTLTLYPGVHTLTWTRINSEWVLTDSVGTLNKSDATTAPTANEDAGDGYSVGSVWIDVTNDKAYVCVDATSTAAVWKQTGGSRTSAQLAADLTDETGTGSVVLNTNGQRALTTSPGGADDTYAGNTFSGLNNSGGVTQWDVVYLNGSSQWVLADANGSGTFPARGLAVSTVSTGNATTVIEDGVVRNDAWTWTPGGTIYLSVTAGALTQTAPSTTGDKVQVIGYAIDADTMRVKISSDYGTAP